MERAGRIWAAGIIALGLAVVSLGASVRPQFIFTNPPTPAPALPFNPTPVDGATGVSTTQILAWSGGLGSTSYDVRYGTTNPPPLVSAGQLGTTYNPGTTLAGTTYYWQIIDRNASGSNVGPVWGYTTAGSGSSALVSAAKLSLAGCFLLPDTGTTSINGNVSIDTAQGVPSTFYFNNSDGKRHWLVMGGDYHLWEEIEPALLPCSTAVTSLNLTTPPSWDPANANNSYGGDWGLIPITSTTSNDGLPHDDQAIVLPNALGFNAAHNYLYEGWLESYGGGGNPGNNGIGILSMNFTTHTLSVFGCYTSNPNVNQEWTGSGFVTMPSSWITANAALLPASSNGYITLGTGGSVGYASLDSYGPTLEIEPLPTASNPCTSGVSFNFSAGMVLAGFGYNTVGPTCTVMGCTPSQAPTHPFAAMSNFTGYSNGGGATWDPYGGHGWLTTSYLPMDCYDDGVVSGCLVPYGTQSGWSTSTILASPSPTYNGSTQVGTFAISSIDAHDGYNMNVGDAIWMTTCTPTVDGSGCVSDPTGGLNNMDKTGGVITSVTGSGPFTITYRALALDAGNGTGGHVPVPGQIYFYGNVYAHGDTGLSFARSMFRLQIIDPAEYTKVLNGTYATTDLPTYHEEIDATRLFPTSYGGPATGSGVLEFDPVTGANAPTNPARAYADPGRQQFIVQVSNAPCPAHTTCGLAGVMVVWNVGH